MTPNLNSTGSADTLDPMIQVVEHPLVEHKLTLIRDKSTSSKDFGELLQEISMLMAFEVTRDLPLEKKKVKTPLTETEGGILSGEKPAVVAILRAGLGMVGGIMRVVPGVKVGHIGLYRDPDTLRPVHYYQKLPGELGRRLVILADPMLATGYSAVKALDILKQCGAKRIVLMSLIAAPEGLKVVRKFHKDVKIHVAAIDKKLNSRGYIVPGLGDAGDRIFGTQETL